MLVADRSTSSQRVSMAANAPLLDSRSRSWPVRLHATGPARAHAIADLHEQLRREAAFHIRRRVSNRTDYPRSDIDDLAVQAADDALVALLRKLDDFRGDSQFWTWARRFAALEAPVSIRRRVGRGLVGVSSDPDHVLLAADRGPSLHDRIEAREELRGVGVRMSNRLTPRQRAILLAVAVDGVATAQLAEELDTTSGAIYKSLHDARRKLRPRPASAGVLPAAQSAS
jgi:RNA polymerase sigma-70 factor (ECF subfamily)